jgi:hypothetical protein
MNKKLHVATSPLSNTIFAGGVLKDGRTWAANKCDVTTEALVAVAEHVVTFGKPVLITKNGKPEFEITVKKFEENQQ